MESVNPQTPNLVCLPASTRCLLFLVSKGPVGSIPRQIHNYPLTPGQTPQGFDLISWMQGSLASGGLTSEDDKPRGWLVFILISAGAGQTGGSQEGAGYLEGCSAGTAFTDGQLVG